jgi:hypothetical protein
MTSVESSNQQNTKTSFFHRHQEVHLPDQLLRLRIIDGQFEGLKQSIDTYAVVSIGKQSARTKIVKNSNCPRFEENFAIGYNAEDEKSEIVIDLFERGSTTDERLGEFRLRLSMVDPPKNRDAKKAKQGDVSTGQSNQSNQSTLPDPKKMKTKTPAFASTGNMWAKVQPRKAVFVNRKGEEVGFFNILVRREARLHGSLNIHVSEIDLSANNQDFWATPTHIVAKLGQERFESSPITTTQGMTRVSFPWDLRFLVNDNNNISDVFFELWQSGKAVAEARLPLFDTRKHYNGELAFIGPFGGHDVTNTNEKNLLAKLILTSNFDNQMLA